ncbi:hypothetical protein STCU_04278 [Strigomonas culicis]|uniref:Uncharacterized protein n=1 Tax=Strigomonas culicis TaxID=28005 RepID=S9VSB1_9TRYP|nr:hypothetical protein STCU_04278 [Strigomonas culicis]|eukprot:EPY30016.1 hypothetical protein STCU_04278 [Strigomonas culicis]
MSSHFANMAKTETESRLRWLFSTSRPLTPGEIRFRKHAYYRGAVVFAMACYFAYCNPEYSIVLSYIRERNGWTDETPSVLPKYWTLAKQPVGPAADVALASQMTPLDRPAAGDAESKK